MTTVTFDQNIKLPKRHFKSLKDFLDQINPEDHGMVFLRELDLEEVTPDMKKAHKEAQKTPKSGFVNL